MTSFRLSTVPIVRRLWSASPALAVVGLGFVPVFGLSMLGLVVDDRWITGSPAWLKPAKFAISSSVYCLTLAWLIVQVERPSRLLRVAGGIIAVVLAVEVGIIDMQAARGTTSHFNVATRLDAGLFAVMGVGIATLLLASAAVTFALCRESFADRAWGWAVRLGMGITVLGAATGGLMLGPTGAQKAQAQAKSGMPTVGSHTVGDRDSGPGLMGIGWSRTSGDLRVPHFFGLHAVQVVPILAWLAFLTFKPRTDQARTAWVMLISAGYLGLIAVLMAQALAGRPFLSLDAMSLRSVAIWAGLTLAGGVVLVARDRSRANPSLTMLGA